MIRPLDACPRPAHTGAIASLDSPPVKGDVMTWQTPAAVDFRFGFEITMYVAAR